MPLHYSFPPSEEISKSVYTALLNDVHDVHGDHLTTGFVGNKYVLPVLTAGGNATLALEVALQRTYPSWGYQIVNGATTLWENWSGAPDDTNGNAPPSHNHHFMGGYGQWMHESLLGLRLGPHVLPSSLMSDVNFYVDTSSTAFGEFVVRPEVVVHGALSGASARWILPRGDVRVEWRRDGLCKSALGPVSFSMNVTVPVNTKAMITVPLSGCGHNIVSEQSTQIWPESGGHVPGVITPPTLDQLPDGIAAVTLEVGSGEYFFTAL